ncbi:MAG TPA: DUF4349 domain-containing protein [Clostridiales bacterium]|nr:DUF4349 domain-containing protein [Clostridiales bacterium]
MHKRILPWILAILLLLVGCAADKENAKAPDGSPPVYQDSPGNSAEYGESHSGNAGGQSGLSIGATNPEQKIIYTVRYQMETTEFAAASDRLKGLTSELGGYIESSDISTSGRLGYVLRTGHYALRIPTENLNDFFAKVGDIGHIVQEKLESTDVTLQFVDTTARLNALKAQETRILEILKDATDLQYVLDIERELSNIRSEIESLTSRLNKLSSLVEYSTVNVSLREVGTLSDVKPVPKSFSERLAAEFKQSVQRLWGGLQDVGIWFFGNIIEILFWVGLIAVMVWFLFMLVRKSRKRAKEEALKRYEAALYSESAKENKDEQKDE